ncbi:hypothetical protein [Peribacillus asahii]|uniref:hypothetical protein n=1 Tax=Peribacillus asahii TaxID=228899 RepID=UPI0020795298|nr:hypothetical protein [Peribacillus asahii]USK71739.1 hypothetical protein LIS76_08290 [Peribacillus asahii]
MFRQMIGFNGNPLCVIYWHLNGQAQSKTVCYTEDDKKWALDRFDTVGDFYNSYEKAVIDYGDEVVEYGHLKEMSA